MGDFGPRLGVDGVEMDYGARRSVRQSGLLHPCAPPLSKGVPHGRRVVTQSSDASPESLYGWIADPSGSTVSPLSGNKLPNLEFQGLGFSEGLPCGHGSAPKHLLAREEDGLSEMGILVQRLHSQSQG